MEILVPIAVVVIIALFVGYLQRGRQKISCPACNSPQVRLVEKQLEKLTQNRKMGYATKLDVQLIMKTAYRCQSCEHSWTVVAPES
ncbi:MAG: hypothetical protein H6656_12875 [Ardenticatenaceae bacterium]|nr:hypothetical protein [Ardenticatenaceae bacterium]